MLLLLSSFVLCAHRTNFGDGPGYHTEKKAYKVWQGQGQDQGQGQGVGLVFRVRIGVRLKGVQCNM